RRCKPARGGPGRPPPASLGSAPQPLLERARPAALGRGGHLDVVLAHALDAPVRSPVPAHLEWPAMKPRFVVGAETVTELDGPPRSLAGDGDRNLARGAGGRRAGTR